jgi:hypothetical protein
VWVEGVCVVAEPSAASKVDLVLSPNLPTCIARVRRSVSCGSVLRGVDAFEIGNGYNGFGMVCGIVVC